jgi:hypothetical protein
VSGPGRYDGVARATITMADGRQVAYLRRRLLPQPAALGPVRLYVTGQADRVELIAARELGDPLRSWLLADANAVMRPSELSEPGRTVRVPRPGGVEVAGRGQ